VTHDPGILRAVCIERSGCAWVVRDVFLLLLMIGLVGCGHEEPSEPAKITDTPAGATTLSYELADPADAKTSATTAGPDYALMGMKDVEPSPRPTTDLPEGASCITPGCHTTLVSAKYIHGPVAVADCLTCHGVDTGGHEYPLKRAGNQSCTFCHPVVGARTQEHAAVQDSGCIACHDPHKSDTKFLLNQPTVELVCATCHETPLKKYAHGPFAAGQCTVCHQPHEANAKNLLRQGDQPGQCFSCHTGIEAQVTNSPFVHEPVKQTCTTCHDAHTSGFPYQLSAAIPETCFSCHEEMAKRIKAQPVSHDAMFIKDGCANCHDPHAAAGPNLLRDRADRLCMTCHNQPIEAADGRTIPDMQPTLNRRFLHGPVRAGDCAACHSVHGGENARLLRESFPDTFYASFDLTNYALCFECHSSDLVLTETTDTLTGFRDGNQNLHYLHVNRDKKGRTCKACHDIHGSDRPDHIAEEVPFEGSSWAMPINFTRDDDGGSCAPGCHEAKSYRRSTTPNTNAPTPPTSPITPPPTQTPVSPPVSPEASPVNEAPS
jgi:predicted CXXCH cytochrome family protein